MQNSLDKMESRYRREAHQRARESHPANLVKALLFGLVFSPGALLGSMFIPVFGLLLALAVVIVGLIYARLNRSIAIVLATCAGAAVILVLLSIIATLLGNASSPLLYTLLACCVASDLIALLVLGGAIIETHESGFAVKH